MSSPPEFSLPEPIQYDEDGDLILYVDDDSARYQVCSRTLARSSPVFRRMLRGGFAESRPVDGTEWIVELPGDKSEPTQIFLSIIHSRFNEVPKILSISSLHDLLVLTEKYDATEVLQPWAAGWIEAVDKKTEDHSIIGIAWELGQVKLFTQLMEKITEHSTLDASGCLLFGGRERRVNAFKKTFYEGEHKLPLTMEYLEPTQMIENITKNRQSLLEAEFKPYHALYNEVSTELCDCPHGTDIYSSESGWACDSMVLGCLTKGFVKHNLNLALPTAMESYPGSVTGFREFLQKVRIGTPHEDCCDSIIEMLQSGSKTAGAVKASLDFVTQDQTRYLTKQAKKLGLEEAGKSSKDACI